MVLLGPPTVTDRRSSSLSALQVEMCVNPFIYFQHFDFKHMALVFFFIFDQYNKEKLIQSINGRGCVEGQSRGLLHCHMLI